MSTDLVAQRYWEERARRFAGQGRGLAAVCSYGMPGFYNRAIAATQHLALRRWLLTAPPGPALDVGCGVGRWTRLLAANGRKVTGVDLSLAMLAEARRRAAATGLADRCRFLQADLKALDLEQRYSLVLAVTVLQHIVEDGDRRLAIQSLAQHLAPGGRLVLLEAAPSRAADRCDHPRFVARSAAAYEAMLAAAGLQLVHRGGVDPTPFKTWLLPIYARLPAPLAQTALLAATVFALPIDLLLGRRLPRHSWHKVFVATTALPEARA